jgi:hypothetical protein
MFRAGGRERHYGALNELGAGLARSTCLSEAMTEVQQELA